jgi:predicted nucleotide-binding protein
MAPRRPNPPLPERPFHTVEQKRQDIERLQRRIRELEAFDPQTITKRFSDPAVTALETAIDETLAAIFGHATVEYRRYSHATSLDHGPVIMNISTDWITARGGGAGYRDELAEARQYAAEGKQQALSLLRQAVRGLEEEIELATPDAPLAVERAKPSNKVFVVHGHDEAALQAVARFLERLRLEAVILREELDAGRTIIEKFEDCAADVGFAVVLLTPDDLGGIATGSATASRARQNVIFELGYFAGKLGRGRACLMRKGAVEIPSDLYGVIYTDLDSGEAWKMKLVKELKAAKLEFDANRMW